jgi:uncharacterized membrane protein
VELINPYAVMRNTATFEAYKARQRGLLLAAQPFASIGILCGVASWAMIFFPRATRWAFEHLGPASLLIPAGLILVGTVCVAIGFLNVRRYRRDNPIPDEWRQVPRVRSPLAPSRKP